jgi:hypothetical protein
MCGDVLLTAVILEERFSCDIILEHLAIAA